VSNLGKKGVVQATGNNSLELGGNKGLRGWRGSRGRKNFNRKSLLVLKEINL